MKLLSKQASREVFYSSLLRAMRTFLDTVSGLLGTVVVADVISDFKGRTIFYGLALLGAVITGLLNFAKNYVEGLAAELAEVDARGTTA